jgi:predicted acetyltransferase
MKMELEIRSIQPSEAEEFNVVARLGFGLPPDFKVKLDPDWTLCAFVDGRLATTYAAWPLEMYFSGAIIPVGGITWVSTHPLYRRHNCLRQVTETHFKRLHETGGPAIIALQASLAAIYQRYGYAVVSTKNSYSIEPQYLRWVSTQSSDGQLREASEADIDSMVAIYNRFAEPRVGFLKRGPQMQNAPGNFSVLMVMPPALPVKIIYRESGQDLGYAIYSSLRDTSGGNPLGQRIVISDIAYLSPAAYHAIWSYFSHMDIINRIDWGKAPQDDPLPHLLQEPRKLNLTAADGLLGRLVDVERALPQRPYSDPGLLTFDVIDELCPWNQGSWSMEVSPAGNEIKHYTGKTQLTLPVSTLAMLFFGQINATQAAAMGRLEVNQLDKLALWDKIWRTAYRPACADVF